LGVPDDAAAPVIVAILRPRLSGAQPFQRAVYSAVLLIAGDGLDGLAANIHEQKVT